MRDSRPRWPRPSTGPSRRRAIWPPRSRSLSALDGRQAELDGRSADLDAREAALAERESTITATEEQVAASQIGNGIWTVGVDIEPGTYRTAEAVTSMCYWAILVTGTNGDDIIINDLPDGGFPTVTLSEGQDFDNSCGVWSKQ
ncbi:hypothetical protein [Georgenia yuyongxinii]